jgi:hypothetical protein
MLGGCWMLVAAAWRSRFRGDTGYYRYTEMHWGGRCRNIKNPETNIQDQSIFPMIFIKTY